MGWMTAFSLVAIFVFLAVLWRQSKVNKGDGAAVGAGVAGDVSWQVGEVPGLAGRQCIADIEFDYRNSQWQESHRRVEVEAVDAEYFQGYCHKAGETRTFLIARVRGEVLDLDSGELLPAKDWAKAARLLPGNNPALIDIGRDREGSAMQEADETPGIEVCFTGFVKADKYRLEGAAELAGMVVRHSVTKGLDFLVAGGNAGPAKLKQADEVGAMVISQAEFLAMCEED